jgi:hypothetical protein
MCDSPGDGQYFHYITKFCYALLKLSEATREPKYLQWAVELAHTAHSKFVYTQSGSYGSSSAILRMHWKMNVNLTKPMVKSEGHLDPLDGYVTCKYVYVHFFLKLNNVLRTSTMLYIYMYTMVWLSC